MSIRVILTAFVDSDSKYNKVKEISSNYGDGEGNTFDLNCSQLQISNRINLNE